MEYLTRKAFIWQTWKRNISLHRKINQKAFKELFKAYYIFSKCDIKNFGIFKRKADRNRASKLWGGWWASTRKMLFERSSRISFRDSLSVLSGRYCWLWIFARWWTNTKFLFPFKFQTLYLAQANHWAHKWFV